jgi:hypothetical protein
MLISIEGHSVVDFDTQSVLNRWWTTLFKASWILSTLYDDRLDGPAIREPNLEIDDKTLIPCVPKKKKKKI